MRHEVTSGPRVGLLKLAPHRGEVSTSATAQDFRATCSPNRDTVLAEALLRMFLSMASNMRRRGRVDCLTTYKGELGRAQIRGTSQSRRMRRDVCPFLVPRIRANGNEWGGEDTVLLKTNFALPLRYICCSGAMEN